MTADIPKINYTKMKFKLLLFFFLACKQIEKIAFTFEVGIFKLK